MPDPAAGGAEVELFGPATYIVIVHRLDVTGKSIAEFKGERFVPEDESSGRVPTGLVF